MPKSLRMELEFATTASIATICQNYLLEVDTLELQMRNGTLSIYCKSEATVRATKTGDQEI